MSTNTSSGNLDASAAAGGGSKPPQELTSILSQVQHLQSDRERLLKELEDAKAKMDRLQEGKREEMKKVLDTVIAKWLADSVKSDDARQQFTEGMERLVKDTRAESGIWTVACEASQLHASKLEEIERLRLENETLKAAGAGSFRDESSRKRGREESQPNPNDFWAGFDLDVSAARL
jgi:hypothetical protein